MGYRPKHMAYSPKNELAFRLGMAVTLSATLVCATPAFAAEAQTSGSTAQQTQASTAAVTETAQDTSSSSTIPAATTATAEEDVSNKSAAATETKQTVSAATASSDSSTKEDQTTASVEPAAPSSSTESFNAESSSNNTKSVASESQPTSTAETSEKSAGSNDSTASNGASDTETSMPTASAESDSAAATASEAANTTAAAPAKVQALSANVETEEKTELDGIDISGYQKGIDIAAVPSDFVIVKVSEGTDSTATFKEQAEAALKAGKLLGLYHFANADTTASAQAEFFADSVKDYLGKALLFLDWEDTSYSKVREKGTSWAAEWLERVYRLTGVKPLIYMNKNATREYDFSEIAKEYKLWAAQYADMDAHDGYQDDPWQDTKGYGAWGSKPTIFQYSSTTHLDGYDGNLDVDKFYGTKEDWKKLAAVDSSAVVKKTELSDGLYEIGSLVAPGRDVEVAGGNSDNGTRIQNWSANDTAAQRWRIKKLSDGTYTIINVRTGKSLDIPSAQAYSTQRVQEYTFNGTKAQRWYIEEDVLNPGSYVIESALNRLLVLDVTNADKNNGAAIQLYKWNGTLAQLFSFKALKQLVADGVYNIRNAGSLKLLDVDGASLDSTANVQQYDGNGTYAQVFEISYDQNDGYYTIMNVQSGRVLDVANAACYAGANVWQYSSNNTYAQKWAIKKTADGTYQIISARNSLALDVRWGSKDSGANVWVYDSNDTKAQRWTFENIKDWLKEGSYQIVSELNHDNAMAVSKSSTASGAPVYTRVRENGNTAQAWYITKTSDGYVRLTNVGSGLVLDLASAIAANGTRIQQYASNGTDAQLWRVVLANNGVKLVSKVNSNFVIDITNANDESFVPLQSYSDNGTAAQRWHLVVFDPLASGRQFEIVVQNGSSDEALWQASVNSFGSGVAGESDHASIFTFESAGNGKYRIKDVNGLYLTADGSSVSEAGYVNGSSQVWTVRFNANTNGYQIVSAASDKALSVNGSSLSLGDASSAFAFHNVQTAADKVINIAADEIYRYGDNGSKYWNYLFGSGWVNWYTTPYCACFASWVLNQAGVNSAGMPAAGCIYISTVARRSGRTVPIRDAQRGDLVLYDWDGNGTCDHIGIIESNRGDAGITTIEGNTSDATGEGIVASKNRGWNDVAVIVRPYY